MSLLHDYTYRILVIGDSNTGKTHIFSNLATNKHISNQIFRPTIGVDFHGKHISEFNGTIDYKKILNKDDLNVLEKNKKLSIIIQKYYNYTKIL